jgi:hypothetical protein
MVWYLRGTSGITGDPFTARGGIAYISYISSSESHECTGNATNGPIHTSSPLGGWFEALE